MKAKIIVVVLSGLAVAGCGTAAAQTHSNGCASATMKTDLARLQRWVGGQSAGQQGANALSEESTWVNQAAVACKAHKPLPLLPLGS